MQLPKTLPKVIPLGAEVSTNRGNGMVVGIIRTKPIKYDVRLVETGKLLFYLTEQDDDVRLIEPESSGTE
jgi:hypothetical protein